MGSVPRSTISPLALSYCTSYSCPTYHVTDDRLALRDRIEDLAGSVCKGITKLVGLRCFSNNWKLDALSLGLEDDLCKLFCGFFTFVECKFLYSQPVTI